MVINIICITNYRLSCRQLSKNFRLSLLYFDFTGAADPVVFLVISLYESRIVRQRVLHSSTVKMERKYLNAAKFSFSKGIFISVVITNICITSPGHWDNYHYFFNCNYRFLATGESYRSLAFKFRIHHSWISVIVRQTLNAICERLQKWLFRNLTKANGGWI